MPGGGGHTGFASLPQIGHKRAGFPTVEEEFQGMGIDEASRLRVVDGISRKRRQMLADLKLDKQGLRDTLRKSYEVCFATPSNGEAPRPAPFACRR